jgi:hypothetical protein
MNSDGIRRNLALGIITKIGIPLLAGVILIALLKIGKVSSRNAIELGILVALAFTLLMFVVDSEIRIASLNELISTGFHKMDKSAEMIGLMEQSVLGAALLTDFLEAVGAADATVNPLLQRLARRQIKDVTWFVRQLPIGGQIAYDGEDREWLLGLTEEAEHSINAISLSTVDAGLRGFDGGLWTSDLGARYLTRQREAIGRSVTIRRIFVFENEELARDETFLKITQMQRSVGIDVRMLDHQLIPEPLQPMIFDFIIFDGAVSYEMTPATAFNAGGTRPAIVRTLLAPMAARIHDLENQFEQLWLAANPKRQINI